MAYRDENGHFISEEEARRRGLIPAGNGGEEEAEPGEGNEPDAEPTEVPSAGWTQPTGQPIFVDVGRGATSEVPSGSPFATTIERLADEAHYGGYYRVFLNGSEVINPEDAPATIESGMRIAITSYDKVG